MNRFQLQALNAGIRGGAADFIARCDARYDQLAADAAARARRHLDACPIVLLAGPSGAGKTAAARRIRAALEASGTAAHAVSLDSYCRDGCGPDPESPLALDVPLLTRHLDDLARGREIEVPCFNFKTRRRDPGGARTLRPSPGGAVILEGLHALNPLFTERCPDAFRIFAAPESDLYDGETRLLGCDGVRLLRRVVRGLLRRSVPALETLRLWASVRRGERLFIQPCRSLADVTLDTSLGYELPVLARLAKPHFFGLPDGTPELETVLSIQRAADRMEPMDPALLPETSLLKEEFML